MGLNARWNSASSLLGGVFVARWIGRLRALTFRWYGGCCKGRMSSTVQTANTAQATAHTALPVAAAINPHFERMGGEGAVKRLVEAFYEAMSTRPDAQPIRAMHPADLTHTKAVFNTYLCEWLGGPRQYSADRGPPRLRRVHQPFAIDPSASQAWLACMRQALVQTGVDVEFREQLLAAFARITAHVQNLAQPQRSP
jgi:hemoglobin